MQTNYIWGLLTCKANTLQKCASLNDVLNVQSLLMERETDV
jgi:hypothetical protein